MQFNPLGNTGLYVSRLCLGAMTFGEGAHPFAGILGATGQQLATRMVDMAFDAGINFFDTANMYSDGESEKLLGKALEGRREQAVLATKVYNSSGAGMNDMGTSRLAIMREVEASLKRLNTDYVDLYQVHNWDHTTPLEETLSALDDLVRSGKVRYIGLSNFAAWQIAKADGMALSMGTHRFVSAQMYYSLVGRELEREVLPACLDLGIGVMVWSPLAGGFLSGKFSAGGEGEGRRKSFDFPPVHPVRGDEIVAVLRQIATELDSTPAQVALAWLLTRPGVSTVILGARTEAQLADNIAAADLVLSEEQLTRLDEVSALVPEYPGWFPKAQRGVDRMQAIREMVEQK